MSGASHRQATRQLPMLHGDMVRLSEARGDALNVFANAIDAVEGYLRATWPNS